MATARAGYFPTEDADDKPGDRLLQNSERRPSIENRPASWNNPRGRRLRSGSRSTDSTSSDLETPNNPRKFISLGAFSLIVIGIAVMFLFGVCVGFYVRELQQDKPDFKKICGIEDEDDEKHKEAILRDKLAGYHESLVYYIRAKGINEFVQ
ncbi:hypothetical protein ElyMa_006643300 [Elysia marginata]|uniref:Uncharacterized protein n=1 Tax=Elysia marginata TaxID=1093978 RepID=A0AAV4IJA3_9GAST|nr:hypothetical protein ElyMa_006643300 [Elysia marginata]